MARSSRNSSDQVGSEQKKPKVNSRVVPPTDLEIEAVVLALLRQQNWQQLAVKEKAYGGQLGLPANLVLCECLGRQMAQYMRDHPEQAAEIEAGLDAAEEEVIAKGDVERSCSLDEVIANLRLGAQKYIPTVH